MIKTEEKEIRGAIYSATQLPAFRALRLKARLFKLFGAALAQMFMPDGKGGGAAKDKDDLIKSISLLAQSVDEATYESLVKEILQGVRKDGIELVPAIVDLEFAGQLEVLYEVLAFVLMLNFGSFFLELQSGLPPGGVSAVGSSISSKSTSTMR